ncbi:MAG: EamA family transporter [Gemmatimonadales bacterium]|nr:EamA family transporter [Gemmatimonadales bacterium]
MIYLIAASFLWAFSFGLIKGHLVGIDPVAVACLRLLLAAAAFSPALFRYSLPGRVIGSSLGLGAIQFGLMYVLYIHSYQWLPAWKVALFTIFTPFFVIWISDLRSGRFNRRAVLPAALAVAGAFWVQSGPAWTWSGLGGEGQWRGILLLQGANLCFAFGQVYFGGLVRKTQGRELPLLAWMYVGALSVTALALVLQGGTDLGNWSPSSLLVVAYLGLVPTALGFYLWNKGAARCRPALLAGANNLKIPLAVIVAWTIFGEEADYLKALIGLAVVVMAVFWARGTSHQEG